MGCLWERMLPTLKGLPATYTEDGHRLQVMIQDAGVRPAGRGPGDEDMIYFALEITDGPEKGGKFNCSAVRSLIGFMGEGTEKDLRIHADLMDWTITVEISSLIGRKGA